MPVGDERQGRTGQQLLELVGAQHVAAEIGLPHSRARPSAVQQRGLTRHQASVLGKETGAVLPVTLLLADTPELLPAGRGGGGREEEAGVSRSSPLQSDRLQADCCSPLDVAEVAAAQGGHQQAVVVVAQLNHPGVHGGDGLNGKDDKRRALQAKTQMQRHKRKKKILSIFIGVSFNFFFNVLVWWSIREG